MHPHPFRGCAAEMVAQTDIRRPVDIPEILRAIQTLYGDRIKPYGRLLMIRLTEHAEQGGRANPDVKEQRIRSLCESSAQLSVQNEKGGEWSVLMRGRESNFVDFHSPEDSYPAELWEAAARHFEAASEADKDLPRARYLCARALEAQQLAFLSDRCLGELMHIVQLAISVKKILGYQKDAIVPYSRSKNKLKEQSAEAQQHHAEAEGPEASMLANWDETRATLKKVMQAQGTVSVPLSRVKQLFEAESGRKLSETALGHAKLSDLLKDARLADILTVQLQSRVYVVCPVEKQGHQRITLDDLITENAAGRGGLRSSPTAGSKQPSAAAFPPWSMPPPMPPPMLPMAMSPVGVPPMPPMLPMGMPPWPLTPASNTSSPQQRHRRKKRSEQATTCGSSPQSSTQEGSTRQGSGRKDTASSYGAETELTGVNLTPGGLGTLGFVVKNGFIDQDVEQSPATGPAMLKSYTEPPVRRVISGPSLS